MKKALIAWLSTLTLALFTQMAFADAPTSPYYSTKHPSLTASANKREPATDILIVNNIPRSIREDISTLRLIVPNSPIDDIIFAKEFDHVKNDIWAGLTHIQLYSRAYNYGQTPFFDSFVTNHAVLTVNWQYDRYMVEVR